MRYEKNFLSLIVCRVDFEPVPAFDEAARADLSQVIQREFPLHRQIPTAQFFFNVSTEGAGMQRQDVGMTLVHNRVADALPAATLAPTFLGFDFAGADFADFAAFREVVAPAFRRIAELTPAMNVTRIGLRYVNEINLKTGQALEWDGMIADELVASAKAAVPDDMAIIRSMHQLQMQQGETSLLLHYGLANPDFPAPVARRQFVLDIDCWQQGTIDVRDIVPKLETLNASCEATFERSIRDDLRKLMGVIHG